MAGICEWAGVALPLVSGSLLPSPPHSGDSRCLRTLVMSHGPGQALLISLAGVTVTVPPPAPSSKE